MNIKDLIPNLIKEYKTLGYEFLEEKLDKLSFQKAFVFTDQDAEKTAHIVVEYERKALLHLPTVRELGTPVLNSMHSIFKYQCWLRRDDLIHQTGLGIISAKFVDEQINKLIKAHVDCEYGTINESPEFGYAFEAKKLVDNTRFFVSQQVINQIIEQRTENTVAISGIAQYGNDGYVVGNQQIVFQESSALSLPTPSKPNLRVYFLATDYIPHYDGYINLDGFVYMLEKLSGQKQGQEYLLNIQDEFILVVTFYNEPAKQYDIVAFRKKDHSLILLPHARINSPDSFFIRNLEEAVHLCEKTVAIAGIGAIGSIIGMNLLQSGIGKLYIIDNDRVDYENITRSVFSEKVIGQTKIDAFMEEAINKSKIHRNRIFTSTLDQILNKSWLEDSKIDLLIVCLGDVHYEYQISRVLRSIGFDKVVFVYGQNDCTWGGIYFQNGPEFGCQQCLFYHQSENVELTMPYASSLSPAIGTGGPSYIGGIHDISILAGIAGKLIVERLICGKGINRPNYYIWQSNPNYSATKSNHQPFSLKSYRIERHHECDC